MESGLGMTLACIILEMNRAMRSVQGWWTHIVDTGYKKVVEHPEEGPSRLVKHVVTPVSNQIKSASYTAAPSAQLEPPVSSCLGKVLGQRSTNS